MSKRRKSSLRDQKSIDWDRGAMLTAINKLQLKRPVVGLGYPVAEATVIHVLRVIDDFQREKKCAWPSLQTIADCAKLKSTKTVSRALDALEQQQIITVTPGTTPQGYPVLMITINWQVIFGREPIGPAKRARRPGGRRQCPEDIGSRPEDIGSKPEDNGSSALYRNRPLNRTKETSPPTPERRSTQFEARRGTQFEAWEEVERELCELGVNAFPIVVKEIRHRVDPQHVIALCRHYRIHKDRQGWTEATLYFRCKSARQWNPPESGWPEKKQPAVPATASALPEVRQALQDISNEDLGLLIRQFGSPALQFTWREGGPSAARNHEGFYPELRRLLEQQETHA